MTLVTSFREKLIMHDCIQFYPFTPAELEWDFDLVSTELVLDEES